ncbi:aspartate aminotransferase family protein [Microvirga aerophila]|uniref:Glutamate-1-semialdehyde 2,1-aminomutase n=1 Tax=Microvirga aerophila TaxID=670291 RepID=A0A512C1R3_9HYPH|nr:aminotransferase class III-fold pyridoxal phosphate-dependent enzyme [Microvirga aerophila]GEO18141.1 glutamate-1-semialdehyde 2,1-aminomutase [Microvirga aerophila]
MGHLVGGISSAGRALPALDGVPFLTSRSSGPYIWDNSGRRYIDTALGFGATIVGHAHPAIIDAVSQALSLGSMPAFAHTGEEAAATALTTATGPLSRVIFTNTGSEAVHLACRIARVTTGRSQIAKMAAGFDGWYDDVAFGNAGSSEAAMKANTRPTKARTTLLRFNDFDDVERLFDDCEDIAAVLVEPMLANAGCILPAPGYLQHVEAVARRNGAIVIADEVLMGFRTRFGLTGHSLGLTPDLATVGKAIGSGIAVAGVVGTPEVMAACERGEVTRAGTYSGNPVATAAVCATMDILKDLNYNAVLAQGDRLRGRIEQAFATVDGVRVATSGYGTVFTIWFSEESPTNYVQAVAKVDPARTKMFHVEARRRGLLTMPFSFGRMYLSAVHDDAMIDEMAEIVQNIAGVMR